MNRNLSRAENYLSLVGLVVLILGGIGVSSVTRVFVQQKVKSIAILKCVGSTSRQVLAIYLTQVVLLGLAGSALGVASRPSCCSCCRCSSAISPRLLQVDYGLTAGAVLQGLAIGVLVSLLFSVVPLLEVRNVKPSLLLAAGRPRTAALRLAEVDRRDRRRCRAGRRRGMAGGIGAGWPAAVRRIRGVDLRAPSGWSSPSSEPCSRFASRARSPCARRCCTSPVPATRRGSFCWPSVSARSSSSGSGRCR